MDERIERLEKAVAALDDRVSRQDRRIALLEGGAAEVPVGSESHVAAVETAVEEPGRLAEQWPIAAVSGTPALIGSSLLILAGAFLLRALTERGTLAAGAGIVFGLAYALIWIFAAAMAARKDARASAGFFAVCAAVIADPLIFEASTEFNVLSPSSGTIVLLIVTTAGMYVASRWRLQETAWVFAVGAMITAAVLGVVRPPGAAATALLVILGLWSVWLAGARGWESLRWLTGIAADVGVLRLTALAMVAGGNPLGGMPPNASFVAFLNFALLLGYVGSSFVRALRGRLPVRLFDYLQTAAAWAIGWGGAVQLARAHGFGTRGLGVFAVFVGLAAYAAAFGVADQREGKRQSFFYLSSLGLGLVLLGLSYAGGSTRTMIWAALALIAAAAGSHWDRVTLRAHAAVLLGAAWIEGGVAAEAVADILSLIHI